MGGCMTAQGTAARNMLLKVQRGELGARRIDRVARPLPIRPHIATGGGWLNHGLAADGFVH